MTQDQILKALSYVDDPDLNKDLVTLGMIQKIEIDGQKVAFDLVLTTPACPMKESIARACTTAIHTMVSADADVQINIPVMYNPAEKIAQYLAVFEIL